MMKVNTAPSVKERWAVIQCWLTSIWRNYSLQDDRIEGGNCWLSRLEFPERAIYQPVAPV